MRFAGCSALALPGLEAFAGGPEPTAAKYLAIVFTANGHHLENFFGPAGSRGLAPTLASMEAYADKITLLAPPSNDYTESPSGVYFDPSASGLNHGIGCVLTGEEVPQGNSVDQFIADEVVPRSMPFRTLQLGMGEVATNSDGQNLVYRDGNPLVARNDPAVALAEIFAGVVEDASNPEVDQLFERRSGVFTDFLFRRFETLGPRLSSRDRQTLDFHLESLLEIEKRLEPIDPPASCSVPPPRRLGPVEPGFPGNYEGYPDHLQLQAEILVMAMACDLSRVITLQAETGQSNARFPHLPLLTHQSGEDNTHHVITHYSEYPIAFEDAEHDIGLIDRYYGDVWGDMVHRMAMTAAPDGNGTLLDQALVYWSTRHGTWRSHDHWPLPVMLAGGAGGALQMGQRLEVEALVHDDVLTSIAHAMGVDPSLTFGPNATGPVPGLH